MSNLEGVGVWNWSMQDDRSRDEDTARPSRPRASALGYKNCPIESNRAFCRGRDAYGFSFASWGPAGSRVYAYFCTSLHSINDGLLVTFQLSVGDYLVRSCDLDSRLILENDTTGVGNAKIAVHSLESLAVSQIFNRLRSIRDATATMLYEGLRLYKITENFCPL